MRRTSLLISIVFLSACTSTLQSINQSLAKVNGKSGVANITPEQERKISAAINVKTKQAQMNQAIAEASKNISEFIKIESCLTGYNGRSLNVYTAPGVDYSSYAASPGPQMKYHDKSSCLSVVRLQGWAMPANNALRFEVVYLSDSSGESAKVSHELVKQPSGDWLFARF